MGQMAVIVNGLPRNAIDPLFQAMCNIVIGYFHRTAPEVAGAERQACLERANEMAGWQQCSWDREFVEAGSAWLLDFTARNYEIIYSHNLKNLKNLK